MSNIKECSGNYQFFKLKGLTFEDLIFADITPFAVGSGSRGNRKLIKKVLINKKYHIPYTINIVRRLWGNKDFSPEKNFRGSKLLRICKKINRKGTCPSKILPHSISNLPLTLEFTLANLSLLPSFVMFIMWN